MTISLLLSLIPIEILHGLHKYILTSPNYRHDKGNENPMVIEYNFSWRNFMNSNKCFFQEWKRKTQYLKLNPNYAYRYYFQSKFREAVIRSVLDPGRQLSICLRSLPHVFESPKSEKFVNFSRLSNIHTLEISFPKGNPLVPLVNVHCLIVRGVVDDFTAFASVKKLVYFHADRDSSPIISIAQLLSLEEFSLKETRFKDFSDVFRNLTKINISSSESISDLSCFRNISYISFAQCANIIDISPLSNAIEVELMFLPGVTDVSPLGRVKKLAIVGCPSITDVSQLHSVKELTLRTFRGVGINSLSHVEGLFLCKCDSIESLTGLVEVQRLHVEHCDNLKEFIVTKENSSVTQENSNSSILEQSSSCFFQKLSELTIEECFSIESMPPFPSLKKLRLIAPIRMNLSVPLNALQYPKLKDISFRITYAQRYLYEELLAKSSTIQNIEVYCRGNESKTFSCFYLNQRPPIDPKVKSAYIRKSLKQTLGRPTTQEDIILQQSTIPEHLPPEYSPIRSIELAHWSAVEFIPFHHFPYLTKVTLQHCKFLRSLWIPRTVTFLIVKHCPSLYDITLEADPVDNQPAETEVDEVPSSMQEIREYLKASSPLSGRRYEIPLIMDLLFVGHCGFLKLLKIPRKVNYLRLWSMAGLHSLEVMQRVDRLELCDASSSLVIEGSSLINQSSRI